MQKSRFLKIVDGYEDSGLGRKFVSLSYSGAVSAKGKKKRGITLHSLGERIDSVFAATRTTCYGAFLISFGIAALLFYFFNEYVGAYEGTNALTLALGIVCSLSSIPLLLIDKPAHRFVSESGVLDYIFFEFLCMKRVWAHETRRGVPTIVGVIVGVLLASLGIFVPLGQVAFCALGLLLVYLSVASPEFPFVLSILIVPYYSYIPYAPFVLAALALLSFLSFFKKTLSGKRTMHVEQYDVFLFVLLIIVCIYALFARENAKPTDVLMIISLFMGYPLASNIIINRRLADSVSNALVVSTLPIAILSSVMRIIALINGGEWADPAPAVCASIIVSGILTIRLIKHAAGVGRVLYILLMVIYLASSVIALPIICTISLVFGLAVTVLYRISRYFGILVFALLLFAQLFHLLPEGVVGAVFSALRLEAPTLASALFGDVFGIIIFALALLLFLVRIRHGIVYIDYFDTTHLKSISVGYSSALAALVLMLSLSGGALNASTLYLTLSVFGMGSAALRVAKSESDNAELYFEDLKDTHSSTASVVIR